MYIDHAIYVNKFEVVNENVLQIASNTSNAEDIKYMNLNSTCLCESENNTLFCNDTELLNIVADTNISTFITKKLILLNNTAFLVLVSRDFVSIYSNTDTEQLYQIAGKSHRKILFTLFTVIIIMEIVTLRNV